MTSKICESNKNILKPRKFSIISQNFAKKLIKRIEKNETKSRVVKNQ